MDRPFVLNLAEAPAYTHSRRATLLDLEPEGVLWPDTGVNVQIMQPGQPNCRYHRETVQEDFLVLHGECRLILGDTERSLREWDYVHCPAGTDHVFIGAGEGPCAVLMIGARRDEEVHYPVSQLAMKYDASVREPTNEPEEAYADWRQAPWVQAENPWPLA